MRRSIIALCTLLALTAIPAAAQGLSQIYRDWAEGPAQHLFTKQDRTAWAGVSNDQQAESFIRLFWARRDPTPDTGDNEFRREFERRAAYADQKFGHTDDDVEVRGSLTDRGRVFILFGPPRRVQQPGAGGSATGGDFGSGDDALSGGGSVSSGGGPGVFGRGGSTERFGVASEEVWVYEREALPDFIDLKRVKARFRSEPGSDVVKLFQGEDILGWLGAGAAAAIVNPGITLADLASSTEPVLAGSGGEDFGLWGADLLNDSTALAALRAALTEGSATSIDAHLDAGAFQASDGSWIVPVQVSTEAGPPGAGTVLVGELVDAGGESKLAFRLEPDWKTSKDQSYTKATLVAPPGDYELRTALEDSTGRVLWGESRQVAVPQPTNDFWISQLVLSEHIFPMQEAQEMLEPWAWQGIVVVPEGDRTFAQGDVLWYYLHACQPALDDNGTPNLRLTVQLSGAASFRGPMRAEPVKAGDNCWVLAQGLDLTSDRFVAGDYELKVNVRDSVAGKTLVSDTVPFKVTAAAGGAGR